MSWEKSDLSVYVTIAVQDGASNGRAALVGTQEQSCDQKMPM